MPKRIHDGLKKRCPRNPRTGKCCARRDWPKCPHPWHFSFHHKGREHRYSLDVIARARGLQPPRSKAEAITWRDQLRTEIRNDSFVDPSTGPPAMTPGAQLSFGDVCDEYLKRHVRSPTRRARGRREMEILIALARRAEIPGARGATVRLEEKPIDAVTKADIEAVRTWRRQQQASVGNHIGAKKGETGTNRLLSRMRHLFNWAIAEGYLMNTPFKRGSVTVVKLETSAEGARTRRLEPGVQSALLKHADPHLRALLVALWTTGCRIGELLSLQWGQIRLDEEGQERWMVLPSGKTKTAEARVIPIGPRLRAELSMRRHAPDGEAHPADAYVFGNEVGEQVHSIRRQWEDTVLRAHGHVPNRHRGKLTTESRAACSVINLHIHDLRREFACSLLESGAALHDVQAFLGHANITTTSRYLQSAPVRLEAALMRLEAAQVAVRRKAGKNRTDGRFAHDSHTRAWVAHAEDRISSA